ncbi:MliC family protein [Tenacibaculum sp. TC6]|uniref:MliC family protein n=1 Tax=Tenacibaculum sp. TC6 TaxID=3423223 RepID=UPI003D35D00B
MNKRPIVLLLSIIFLTIMSCKNSQKTDTTETTTEQTDTIPTKKITFISADNAYKFILKNNKEGIILEDVTHNKIYTMNHVPSGSGAKYEDTNGYIFWNKGNDFTFYKGDQTLAHGQLVNEPLLFIGNYVSEGYTKRSEGYDWVAVSVKQGNNNSIQISIRSRADKKKPTCTFDTKAYPTDNNNIFESFQDGKKILYTFSNDSITITTKNQEDEKTLYFFCSGGATLAGTYTKIQEPLDTQQIDLTSFSKTLTLQKIGFNVTSVKKEEKNTLTIFTFGLEEVEFNETFDIEGSQVIGAEVEDLNSDGSPELFVYTQSDGSGSYGEVFAFSVNNKKSMSQVYFPPTAENKAINKGYMGHDQFSLVETSLVQRFPIYKDTDTNSNPTGGTRQVSYKLVDGEAMRQLVIDKVTEF